MINFIIWIIIGGLLGWVASMIMGTNAQQGTLMNIIVGIVGAFLAGFALTPLFGIATINPEQLQHSGNGHFVVGGRYSVGHT